MIPEKRIPDYKGILFNRCIDNEKQGIQGSRIVIVDIKISYWRQVYLRYNKSAEYRENTGLQLLITERKGPDHFSATIPKRGD